MTSGREVALLAGGAAALLVLAAVILLLRRGAALRMQKRLEAVGLLHAGKATATGPNIRVTTRDERRLLERLLEAVGYNPDLPPGYAASVPLVVAAAAAAGALGFVKLDQLAGPLFAGVGAVALAALVARFLFRRKTNQHANALFNQIPDTISLVLRAVRAGLPVSEAIRNLSLEVPSPSAEEFARVSGEVALGVPMETALWNLYARTRVREFAFFAVVLSLNGQTGGNLAETLENLADMVRRRVAMARKARAISGEAKASATILGGLPFVVGLLLAVINPQYIGLLFTDPRGPGFLFAFVALLSSGLLTIRWLIQRSTQD